MSEIYYPVLSKEITLPYYVTGVGVDYVQGDIDRQLTGHETAQFIITKNGCGNLIMDEKSYAMKENTLLYLPKGYHHEYHPAVKGKWTTYWIGFNGNGVDDLLKSLGLDTALFVEIGSSDKIFRIMKRITSTLKGDRIYGNYHASAYLYELFIEVNKQVSDIVSETDFNADSRIVAIINYLEQHYNERVTMHMLCEIADLSEQHLCRLFKKFFNSRPMEYLEKLRMNEAKKLLMNTQKSMQVISEMVGYENSAYFSKLFKRHENLTPTEFRMIYNKK